MLDSHGRRTGDVRHPVGLVLRAVHAVRHDHVGELAAETVCRRQSINQSINERTRRLPIDVARPDGQRAHDDGRLHRAS